MKKNRISDSAKKQFLALLRAGLWGKEADMGCFPEESAPDWNGILYLGRTQAVLPLVYDGMLTLPSDRQLKGPALMKLLAYVDKIEKLNMELNDAVTEISSRLSAEGIRSVLLKGQGLAALYRNPLHRQCGDIDLYVGEENYRKAADIIRQWPEIHRELPENIKHITFSYKNVEIELHRNAFQMPGSRLDRKYRILEQQELENGTDSVYADIPVSDASAKGKTVVPPVLFNVFYTFCHAFSHFMISGLGLRQMCDVAVLLERYGTSLDLTLLHSWLKDYKLDKEWKMFICLLVDFLGLPPSKAPLYDNSLNSVSAKLLDTIFNDGNFGQYKSLPDYSRAPLLIRKTGSLINHHILFIKRIRFSFRQTCMHYFHLWHIGLFNAFKEMN